MYKKQSIRFLLILAFLLVSLLPAILFTGLSFYQAKTALKKEISHDMKTLAEALANDIQQIMFERLQNVHSWCQQSMMQDLKIDDVDKRLSGFLQELQLSYGDVYQEIHAQNLAGLVVASSNPKHIGQQVAELPVWLSVVIRGNQLQIAPIKNQTLMISGVIYSAETQQPIGKLVAVFNWQKIEQVLSQSISKEIGAALIDGQKQVLAASEGWASVEAGHAISVSMDSTQPNLIKDWQVKLAKRHSEAVAPVHRMGYIFLGLLLLTLLLAVILARPIIQAITQPLAKLTEFVKNIRHSSFTAYAPSGLEESPVEVQALTQAFQEMMIALEKSQENLTRAAKLAVVGEMSAAISHEVRTPLGIFRSSAQVLLREPGLSKEGREVCGFIISETERMNKLVSTLIDAARPQPPNFAWLDINALTQQTVAMLEIQAKQKNIDLQCTNLTLSQDTLSQGVLMVHGDAEQLTQVLMNLILNAIQILPANIEKTGKIIVKTIEKEDFIELTVADNGPGISAENQAAIFEPFFTRRPGGVGLGLAIVKHIISLHHGQITCQAGDMQGAEFKVVLPKISSEQQPITHQTK